MNASTYNVSGINPATGNVEYYAMKNSWTHANLMKQEAIGKGWTDIHIGLHRAAYYIPEKLSPMPGR